MTMIATSIEQSQHLLELGLDPKTADMFWKYSASLGNKDINGRIAVSYHDNLFVGKYDGAIPAWSLSALLELMPKVIVHDMNKHVLCLKYAEGAIPLMYYVVENGRNKGKLIRFDNGRCAPDAGGALDAAYQMVCWLLEQGIIEKV